MAGANREVVLTLQDAATNDVWIRHLAGHMANTGGLDQELSRLTQLKSTAVPANLARRMTYLLRAKGD
ncbi:hypothetical protein, partial [Salmonella sp. SAL4359]|uniref:hypothetical protein n=1 Tax=Salmonella sp. SAL4359 TaxID=3159880 RepID=UPI00397C44D3